MSYPAVSIRQYRHSLGINPQAAAKPAEAGCDIGFSNLLQQV
jgi:hypothetical protein